MKDQMQEYREAFIALDFEKATSILEKSELKKDQKSLLLWHLESGTLALSKGMDDASISHFQGALDLIDKLYTTKLSAKLVSYLINDASDVFYGANYERSYAHYFLARAYYSRYLKQGKKIDLQAARATILAWDTYFVELGRSSSNKSLYSTDLMLKVFGGQIHEVSGIRNDKQIALQLYKDALQILETQGGIYSFFNSKSGEYIREFESKAKANPAFYAATLGQVDLKNFLHYKILSLTSDVRGSDFNLQVKDLKAAPEIVSQAKKPANVVLILEEGTIPAKVAKPFNFGIKGAINAIDDPKAKAFIKSVGTEFLTSFAMNKLGLIPTQTAGPGNFLVAHSVTKLAVSEAAIEFELPMIDNVPLVQRLELFILDDKGVIVNQRPVPVVSENGDLARLVLEENVVSQYVKTGTRVAVRHLIAIVAAMQVYQKLNGQGGDFLAKSAAMATYVGAAQGIAALEKADTRHWTTLPQAIRMSEFQLKPGNYQVGIAAYAGEKAPGSPVKIVGNIVVKNSGKAIHHLRFNQLN